MPESQTGNDFFSINEKGKNHPFKRKVFFTREKTSLISRSELESSQELFLGCTQTPPWPYITKETLWPCITKVAPLKEPPGSTQHNHRDACWPPSRTCMAVLPSGAAAPSPPPELPA